MKQVYYISHTHAKTDARERRLQSELRDCGLAYEYTENVYILTTELSLREVYRKIQPYLTETDRVFGI